MEKQSLMFACTREREEFTGVFIIQKSAMFCSNKRRSRAKFARVIMLSIAIANRISW